ncbi:MAG: LamG domain-containing protein [Candidatus Peribacteraceae bacterium]|nr:LamG domain-containing protein [Candidatus Peribacteraceae bacterium]
MPNTESIDLESGSTQYLSITDALQTGLDITGDMTIEFWLKPESLAANMCIVAKWDSGSNQRGYRVEFQGTDVMDFAVSSDGTDGNTTTATWDTGLTNGQWDHWAITYDASAGTCAFYLNGATDGTGASLKTAIHDSTSGFFVGIRKVTGSPSSPTDGLVDEVRIWNDIRTSGEISANYDKQLVGDEAGLVGYWQLNDDLLDQTANDNDLTNNNAATFSTDVPFVGGVETDKFFLVM